MRITTTKVIPDRRERRFDRTDIEIMRAVPEADRTAQERYDLAYAEYEELLDLYEYERRRWAEVWTAAGKTAPPCPAIKPKAPDRPPGLDCETCDGSGYVPCGECDNDKVCPDCDGDGAPRRERAKGRRTT